jgi:hypothetical protein
MRVREKEKVDDEEDEIQQSVTMISSMASSIAPLLHHSTMTTAV